MTEHRLLPMRPLDTRGFAAWRGRGGAPSTGNHRIAKTSRPSIAIAKYVATVAAPA